MPSTAAGKLRRSADALSADDWSSSHLRTVASTSDEPRSMRKQGMPRGHASGAYGTYTHAYAYATAVALRRHLRISSLAIVSP